MCLGSKRILRGKARGNIHERLYQEGVQKHIQKATDFLFEKDEDSSIHSVAPRRKILEKAGKIEDRLNQDAVMRRTRQDMREKQFMQDFRAKKAQIDPKSR